MNNDKIVKNVDKSKYFTILMLVFIALIGLINMHEKNALAGYYCGLFFFIFALFVSKTHTKTNEIIFIFSHGLAGLGTMIGFSISSILDGPIMHDGFNNIYI